MAGMAGKRGFGRIRRLPSKRYQASFVGPDLVRHPAPTTFQTKGDAEAWLSGEQRLIGAGTWTPPKLRTKGAEPLRFGAYASAWLAERPLKPRTRAGYRDLLDKHLLPTFGGMALASISPATVRAWYAGLGKGRPTTNARAYGLLRTILGTALTDGEVAANPVHIRAAGSVKRARKIRPASLDELEAIVAALPERYRAMALLCSWCGLRFGEVTELRRRDVDLKAAVLRIRRGVVRVDGEVVIAGPKSEAGIRDVAIPPHLVPVLARHLVGHVATPQSALLFPAADRDGTGVEAHMAPSSLYRVFYPARAAAGRPDLRWHDLRHTGAVLAASTGATLAELMGRLGHSTPGAAMRYQHVAQGRDAQIAAALSQKVDTRD